MTGGDILELNDNHEHFGQTDWQTYSVFLAPIYKYASTLTYSLDATVHKKDDMLAREDDYQIFKCFGAKAKNIKMTTRVGNVRALGVESAARSDINRQNLADGIHAQDVDIFPLAGQVTG